MATLDLEWLKVFDEVYQTASVSKAAERLGLAQAAASTALNNHDWQQLNQIAQISREALQAAGLDINMIKDVPPVPHNGCRPPKRRRV